MTDKIKVKKERLFHINLNLWSILKIFGFIIGIILFYLALENKLIEVHIIESKNTNESYLFTILNSMMLLLFMVSCGFQITIKQGKWKLVVIIIIIYILYLGFTEIGIQIIFNKNFGLLLYKTYESNTKSGVKFFIYNFFTFWIFVYIISFIFESEKE